MSELVCVERDGAIATVVLNRPEKLNALIWPMWQELTAAMEALGQDESLRCVVLRGAGERAFGPGADIGEFETLRASAAQARTYGEIMGRTFAAIRACPHPTLAAIQGLCVGGSLALALSCDLRITARAGRFGFPINRLGINLGPGELESLVRVVGRTQATAILLEGRVFGADEALAQGLVTRVVDDAGLWDEIARTAASLAGAAPLSQRVHKRMIARLDAHGPWAEEEIAAAYACFDSEDFHNAYKDFLAKRTPVFHGR